MLLCSTSAKADPAQYSLSAPVTVEYDTNPRMAQSGGQSIVRERFVPRLDAKRVWGTDTLNLTLGANIEQSSNQSQSVNRQDPNLGIAWTREVERDTLSLNGRYVQTSSRTTELEQTGFVAADRTQTTKALDGSWNHLLTERLNFSVGGNFSDVSYDGGRQDSTGLGLTDYTTAGVNATVGYDLNEYGNTFLTSGASVFTPSGNILPSSRYQNLMLGYRSTASDTLQWTAQAGLARIDINSADINWQASLVGSYTGDRLNSSLTVGRLITPSGATGGFTNADQVRWQASYALAERLKAGVEAGWVRSQSKSVILNIGQSNSMTFAVTLSYELAPSWTLSFRGQHRQIDNVTGKATGDIVGLTLTYSHPDLNF